MRLRTRGWIGLIAVVAGLGVVGATLLAGSRPQSDVAGPGPSPAAAATSALPSAAPLPTTAPAATNTGLVIKRVLPIDGPIRYGDWHWDEAGVPAGPLVITVDLDARVLSVFRDGYEIAATAVLLGTQETPTPTGLFPITEKDADHHSTIYEAAPMPYMMRLTNDGVSIHGTTVQNGYASHGCVGVPTPFAKKLFGITKLGTPVYITRGKMVGVGASLTS